MTDEADTDREFWEEPEDPWPDEPEEFDPLSLGPDVPEPPEVPEPPDPDGSADVSADLVKAFWAAVLFANVGLLGVSLGPMLLVFEGRTDAGLAAFLVGVLALVFAYRRYRGYVGDETGAVDGTGDADGTGSHDGSGGGD